LACKHLVIQWKLPVLQSSDQLRDLLVRPWIDYYFCDVLLLIPPYLVHFRGLVERDPVGDDVTRVDLPLLDSLQQGLHIVMHVRLTHFHGDAFAKCSTERHFVQKSTVYARDGQSPALADGLKSLDEARLTDPFPASGQF
jgi:hypothetical protein